MASAHVLKIDRMGRIVLPKAIRDAEHLVEGTPLRVQVSDNKITLVRDSSPLPIKIVKGLRVISGEILHEASEPEGSRNDRIHTLIERIGG